MKWSQPLIMWECLDTKYLQMFENDTQDLGATKWEFISGSIICRTVYVSPGHV